MVHSLAPLPLALLEDVHCFEGGGTAYGLVAPGTFIFFFVLYHFTLLLGVVWEELVNQDWK